MRTDPEDWVTLRPAAGQIELRALPRTLATRAQPAFLARRQQHQRFEAAANLRLPLDPGVSAGIAGFQSSDHHYFLGVRAVESGYEAFVEATSMPCFTNGMGRGQLAMSHPQFFNRSRKDALAGSDVVILAELPVGLFHGRGVGLVIGSLFLGRGYGFPVALEGAPPSGTSRKRDLPGSARNAPLRTRRAVTRKLSPVLIRRRRPMPAAHRCRTRRHATQRRCAPPGRRAGHDRGSRPGP